MDIYDTLEQIQEIYEKAYVDVMKRSENDEYFELEIKRELHENSYEILKLLEKLGKKQYRQDCEKYFVMYNKETD